MADAAPDKSLLERTRERVQQLKLDVRADPGAGKKVSPRAPQGERNLLTLRRYTRSVASAVKKEYTFPGSGGFKPGIYARMRLSVNRDGTVRDIEILESSGNKTFDHVVCRSRIFKTKMPPIPQDVPDDPLVLHIICKP